MLPPQAVGRALPARTHDYDTVVVHAVPRLSTKLAGLTRLADFGG